MPAKSKKTVRRSKKGFEFKPWHAFIIVVLVVITGYVVVRFSQAAPNTSPQAKANVQSAFEACGNTNTIQVGASTPCVNYVRRFFKYVMNDPGTSETGPMDFGTIQQVRAFQGAINAAIARSIRCGLVYSPGLCRILSEDSFNQLKSRGLIKQSATYERKPGGNIQKEQDYIDTDGVVGPMTWEWINTLTYVYLVGS